MDLFKLIVLIALLVVLAILLLSGGQIIPAAPRVGAMATAQPVAQVTPTQPAPTATLQPVTQVAPTQPVPTAILQPVAPRLTLPVAGATLNEGKTTFKGTGQPGSKVQVLANGVVLGEAVVGGDGTWTLAVDLGKSGSYTLSVQDVDASGKLVAASDPVSVVLAVPTPVIVAPSLTSPMAGDKLTVGPVTLKGTGAPGSEVELVVDGKAAGRTKVDSGGAWVFNIELGQPGAHQVTVRTLDTTGKMVAESAPVSLSVAAAVVKPVITSPVADASLPSGPVALAGTGQANDELEIVDGGKVVGAVKVNTGGQWRFTYTPASGEHELLARVKGNPDVASDTIKVTVAPSALLPTTGGGCIGSQGQMEGDTYIVGACDTLFGICQITGVSLEALLAANPQIKDADLIYPGQVIQLPR